MLRNNSILQKLKSLLEKGSVGIGTNHEATSIECPVYKKMQTHCLPIAHMDITPNIQHKYLESINDYNLTFHKGLSILYFITRSINNKLNDLKPILQQTNKNTDITVLTETWLHPEYEKYYNIDLEMPCEQKN